MAWRTLSWITIQTLRHTTDVYILQTKTFSLVIIRNWNTVNDQRYTIADLSRYKPGRPPAVSEQTRERNMWSIWRKIQNINVFPHAGNIWFIIFINRSRKKTLYEDLHSKEWSFQTSQTFDNLILCSVQNRCNPCNENNN